MKNEHQMIGYFETTAGRIEFELFPGAAPASCDTFVHSVRSGGWDDAAFVRTVREDNDQGRPRIDVVQAMGHAPDARTVEHESTEHTGLRHTAGTMSLARADPGTASGDHVFFCVRDSPALDAGGDRQPDGRGFAAFGRVTRGLASLRGIHSAECVDGDEGYAAGQMLREPVVIIRAVVATAVLDDLLDKVETPSESSRGRHRLLNQGEST